METLGGFAPAVIYFFIYSFLGYLIEIIFCSISEKKLVNRGFLFGPVLPIYGTGMLLVIVSTQGVRGDSFLTFVVAMAVCSVTEYLISWAMEKIFGIRWWDYSEVYKLHLNGRICLVNSVLFGLAGLLIVSWVQPVLERFVAPLPDKELIAYISLGLVALDTIASSYAVEQVRNSQALRYISGDQTNAVKGLARSAIAGLLTGKDLLERKANEMKKLAQQKASEAKESMTKSVKKQKEKVKKKIGELTK